MLGGDWLLRRGHGLRRADHHGVHHLTLKSPLNKGADGKAFGLVDVHADGALRLWDNGTGWSQIELEEGEFKWDNLEGVLENAASKGMEDILYVLGTTPEWAAQEVNDADYPQPGAASAPADLDDWEIGVHGVWIDFVDLQNQTRSAVYLPDVIPEQGGRHGPIAKQSEASSGVNNGRNLHLRSINWPSLSIRRSPSPLAHGSR